MTHKDRWIQIVILLLIATPFIVVFLVVTLPELAQIFIGLMGLGLTFVALLRFLDLMVDIEVEREKENE